MKRIALALMFLSSSAWGMGYAVVAPSAPKVVVKVPVKAIVKAPPLVPVAKPPVVPPVVKPPVVVAPPVTPPVVTPPPATPVAPPPAPAPTPASPSPQPQQSVGASRGTPLAGKLVAGGVGIFLYAVICSKEKERGEDTWFTRYMCLDVKLPPQPQVPFDLGFPA